MSEKQNTVVFYRSWLEALEMIEGDNSISYKFLQAIFDYHDDKEISWDDPMLKLLWLQTVPLLESTKRKKVIARENGKKGGAPKNNANATNEEPKTTKNNLDRDKDIDIDVDKDMDISLDTDQDIDIDKEKENGISNLIGGVSIDTLSFLNDDRVETPQENILVKAFEKSIKKKYIQREDVEDIAQESVIKIVNDVLGRRYPQWINHCNGGMTATLILSGSAWIHKNNQLIVDAVHALCTIPYELWGQTKYEHIIESTIG